MARPAIYKNNIKKMLAEGVPVKVIAETLGCALSTINNYRVCKAWRPSLNEPDGFAWCSRCQQYYPIEMFNKDRLHKNGLQHICKNCNREMAKKFREKQKDLKGK